MTPDYSPAVLRGFLRARLIHRAALSGETGGRNRRAFVREIGRLSSVAQWRVQDALDGTLRHAGPRAALWAALGHFPGDHGVTLTDDGGQVDAGGN